MGQGEYCKVIKFLGAPGGILEGVPVDTPQTALLSRMTNREPNLLN